MGNVLVIGNSGSGKSTLINAVLGEELAATGWGMSGTTEQLEIYPSEEHVKDVPFRIIDTVGFEPSFLKRMNAIRAVRKWSRNSAKAGNEDNQIHVIWFCVEGTSSKLFPDTIEAMVKATSIYRSVPIVVVITKSYSAPERERNIAMVRQAFETNKRAKNNLKEIIPVVAAPYPVNDKMVIPPENIDRLIECTNTLMPEGLKAGKKDIEAFKLARCRALAQSVVAASTTVGAAVGALPLPIADALLLTPTELAEVTAIAKIYGIKDTEKTNVLIQTVIELGTVGAFGKAVISSVKAIPGMNIATSALNAVVASTIIATLGETSIHIFEEIYLGNRTAEDLDWVKDLFDATQTGKILNQVNQKLESMTGNEKPEKIAEDIIKIIFSKDKKEKK